MLEPWRKSCFPGKFTANSVAISSHASKLLRSKRPQVRVPPGVPKHVGAIRFSVRVAEGWMLNRCCAAYALQAQSTEQACNSLPTPHERHTQIVPRYLRVALRVLQLVTESGSAQSFTLCLRNKRLGVRVPSRVPKKPMESRKMAEHRVRPLSCPAECCIFVAFPCTGCNRLARTPY